MVIKLWGLFFLTYVILFGVRLRSWDNAIEGHCYSTDKLARPGDPHPKVDNIYITITCLYLFSTLVYCLQGEMLKVNEEIASRLRKYRAYHVLVIAMLQFPLHTYSVIALRIANEKLLKSGNVEQQWGFGQVAAILLLGGNLVVLLNHFQGDSPRYYSQFKDLD